ncbi:MAG: archaemetzincin family Zn-dependent metalloprotease [Pseudomonadota bacterium]
MSRCIAICPIGAVEGYIISRIVEFIQGRCGIPCEAMNGTETPRYAYDEIRGQYNSSLILKRLPVYRSGTFRILGVTHLDLYVPILKYVYGLARIEGQCAIISLHRLRPQFYDRAPDPHLLMSRIEKTALHEIAHSLGMIHCRDRRCVMYSSTRITDTDLKKSGFCPSCQELYTWHLMRSR